MSEGVDLRAMSYVEYDPDTGRVTTRGMNSEMILEMYERQGQSVLRLGYATAMVSLEAMLKNDDYVKTVDGKPSLVQRPLLDLTFSPSTVAVRQEAVLADVPACKVVFVGPVSGSQDHGGGDLSIGFTTPGSYKVSFEAFPYMPVELTLIVGASS